MKPMVCSGCGKTPLQINEYELEAMFEYNDNRDDSDPSWEHLSQEEREEKTLRWTWYNEGTMNWENGHFACTECYIKMGMPSSRLGWKAP